jgi:hypothetical protein
MQRRKRILTIIVIMAGACVMAAGVAMLELYRAAIREERARLESVAGSQARLVETMVRAATGGQVSLNTVVNRLREAHKNSNGYGRTGEFTLGCREGRNISYLFRHGRKGSAAPSEVPVDSDFAEPMRRAVEGLSGTMRGRDYAGHEVLAAYEPVRGTDLGIVEKVDMAEIRGPFIRAAATAASVTAFVIAIGAFLIYRITRPVIAALESLTRDLEAKVEERTRELREAQGALLRREKPAMLGQLLIGEAELSFRVIRLSDLRRQERMLRSAVDVLKGIAIAVRDFESGCYPYTEFLTHFHQPVCRSGNKILA